MSMSMMNAMMSMSMCDEVNEYDDIDECDDGYDVIIIMKTAR